MSVTITVFQFTWASEFILETFSFQIIDFQSKIVFFSTTGGEAETSSGTVVSLKSFVSQDETQVTHFIVISSILAHGKGSVIQDGAIYFVVNIFLVESRLL